MLSQEARLRLSSAAETIVKAEMAGGIAVDVRTYALDYARVEGAA